MRKNKPRSHDNALECISVSGARVHNLRNISVQLPKGKLVVFTGPSGSGKSSLAFDTLYAEGQRRYVESLSAYARQFLEMMEKPDVDSIEGLSPAISIEQKTIAKNPRSTVGSVTEIYDYLRLLFARVGIAYSPSTGLPIQAQSREQMLDRIQALPLGTKFHLMAPIARDVKGEFRKELEDLRRKGYQRVHVDGTLYELDQVPELVKQKRHNIYVVVDRLVVKDDENFCSRVLNSLEPALSLGKGLVMIEIAESSENPRPESFLLSSHFSCPVSGFTLAEIEPRLFSFNTPLGACETCSGLGIEGYWGADTEEAGTICTQCQGYRLKPEALCVKIGGLHIGEVCALSIQDGLLWIRGLIPQLSAQQRLIAQRILQEIESRLTFLMDVGLHYLTLARGSATLSGGESQRIRLASQIGSGLTGVLYVLDEPSIGLHQRDNRRLLDTLQRLKNLGNTVVVVEHDEDAIRSADYILDFGPGAGRLGGQICAQGSLSDILNSPESLTGAYLRQEKRVEVMHDKRQGNGHFLSVRKASVHNLKNIDVDFPLGMFVCVTGVSGSGKSSLVIDTLQKNIHNHQTGAGGWQGVASIEGLEHIDKMVLIDQSPIGRTPRSNPATYTGVFTHIRDWYAALPAARTRGYNAGRFSFNVKGGRCEACQGDGVLTIEMHFLPDMQVPCEVCKGKRYSRDTLSILYKEKSIADVLEMTVAEAAEFFQAIPNIHNKLQTLMQVGLDYIQVGQAATTLSGGEAQRVKLAKELNRRSTGKTLYILDEPTTGLHFQDVAHLLEVLHRLVSQGNSMIIIEHNLEVIRTADWIIDIGPEGGAGGGEVVAEGTPEVIAQTPKSHTGRYL